MTAMSFKSWYSRMNKPSQAKRVLLVTVAQSVVLYATPVWVHAAKYKKYAAELNTLQRKLVMGITRAYRTIPLSANLVLVNTPPLDLVANEIAQSMGKTTAEKNPLDNKP